MWLGLLRSWKSSLPKGCKKRKRGGQPGHPRHLRPSFPPEIVDQFLSYTLDCCPDCGHTLRRSRNAPRIIQQIEIKEMPVHIEEHQGLAYRKYMRKFGVLVQFCMAHLIRDVKFLVTLADKKQQAYGKRVRRALRDLFGVIHRRGKMSEKGFQKALQAAREQVMHAATIRRAAQSRLQIDHCKLQKHHLPPANLQFSIGNFQFTIS